MAWGRFPTFSMECFATTTTTVDGVVHLFVDFISRTGNTTNALNFFNHYLKLKNLSKGTCYSVLTIIIFFYYSINHSIYSLITPSPPLFSHTKSDISIIFFTASAGHATLPPAFFIKFMHAKSFISSPM